MGRTAARERAGFRRSGAGGYPQNDGKIVCREELIVPEIHGRTLAVAIQAVDMEIHRIRDLPQEHTVPDEEVRLVDFENVAEELAVLYEQALGSEKGLLSYDALVQPIERAERPEIKLSSGTLMMAIQGVQAEIVRIVALVGGSLENLEADDQEPLLSFDRAAAELKELYLLAVRGQPGLPAYESLV
jgi:hypothetical protein